MKFKKITAIAGSVLMTGLTIASAAAAAFPAPFVNNGQADVAIVYGADADLVAANNVHTALGKFVTSTGATTTVTGGDSYKVEKTSTKFHLGDSISDIKSSLDEDELPVILNDGTYTDDDNDEFDYTQKITLAPNMLNLTMFDDNDYKTDSPTVGFRLGSGTDVLTYALEFSEEPLITDLPTSDLTMMGKDYYVLAAEYNKLTLLDSASEAIVSEGDTVTINAGGKDYVVSIEFVDSDSAKLNVNGEITNDISTTETYKLDDGSYLGMKEILYSAKDTGISKVEFSIGNGKLILQDGQEVEMNEDSIDGLTSDIVNASTKLESITINWATDDEVFIAEDSVATMPGFEAVSLGFSGLDYPTEEEIQVSYDGEESLALKNFPLKDSTEDINLLYNSGNAYFVGLGKDTDEQLATGTTSVTFDSDTDAYFVASWNDGRDAESYLMKATNFKVDNNVNKTTFQYKKDGTWTDAKTDRKETDDVSIGNVEFTVGAINKLDKTVSITGTGDTMFNALYSEEGMKVLLPVEGDSTSPAINFTTNPGTYMLQLFEENKDGDIAAGGSINLTADSTSNKVTISTIDGMGATSSEIGSTDIYRNFAYSALATEVLYDKGDTDQKDVKLMYHGDEVAADVFVTSADSVVTTSAAADFLPVKASDINSVKDKNLVIVGGSCINAAAATALGGAYCGDEFTKMTGVSTGQFLIEEVMDKFAAGKTALVVAGYEAADTKNAVTYLTKMKDVDTSTKMVKGIESVQGLA